MNVLYIERPLYSVYLFVRVYCFRSILQYISLKWINSNRNLRQFDNWLYFFRKVQYYEIFNFIVLPVYIRIQNLEADISEIDETTI